MKLSQRRKLAKKTPKQLARKSRRVTKAEQARQETEAAMIQHLSEAGWVRTGPLNDVWKLDNWKPYQSNPKSRYGYVREEGGIRKVWNLEPRNDRWPKAEACMTLRQAYKYQLRLEATGYEKPKNIDDDLADLL